MRSTISIKEFNSMTEEEVQKWYRECEEAGYRKAVERYFQHMKSGKANLCELIDFAMDHKRVRIALSAYRILDGKKVDDDEIRSLAKYAVDHLIYIGI